MTPAARQALQQLRQLPAGELRAVLRHLAVEVVLGDILTVSCDGFLTTLNSAGHWGCLNPGPDGLKYDPSAGFPRSVDGAIQRVYGDRLHRQVEGLVGQVDGTCRLAQRVLFVVDDLRLPLGEIVAAGLRAAEEAGMTCVALPLLRTGVRRGEGGTVEEKIAELVRAVVSFEGDRIQKFRIVASSPELVAQVEEALRGGSRAALSVQIGDITRVPSQALVTGLNSHGAWGGGVDRAIFGLAGDQYHRQARGLIGAEEGTVCLTRTLEPHGGAFENVLFVVDDVQKPLYDILSAGLRAAAAAGLRQVTVPAMRTGVLLSLGGSIESKVADMARAARDARGLDSIRFVVYGEPMLAQALETALRE